MIQKIKDLLLTLLKIWLKIKRFLKKWWAHIINLFVMFVAYENIDIIQRVGAYSIVGFWLFCLLAYYLFWKIFRGETLFEKDE